MRQTLELDVFQDSTDEFCDEFFFGIVSALTRARAQHGILASMVTDEHIIVEPTEFVGLYHVTYKFTNK